MARQPLGFTSYEVKNDERLASAFDRARKEVEDLRIPFNQIAKDFRKSRNAIFQLKGPGGYPDLSPKYKERKKRAFGFAYPILKATGRLAESVTDEGHPENVSRIERDGMELGTQTPYGIYHQSDEPRKKIPLRKFLFIGPESPTFARNKELSGFPERALNTINAFVLKRMGATIKQATGVTPRTR